MWHREIKARADDQIDEEKKKKPECSRCKSLENNNLLLPSFLHRKPGKQLMTEIVIYRLNCILVYFFFFQCSWSEQPSVQEKKNCD